MPKNNLDKAKDILKAIGMPPQQCNDMCGYCLLAFAGIKKKDDWISITNEWTRIHSILEFININYDIEYAENSRETFRKQAIHHFRNAAIIEDNGKATNSPNYQYRITDEAKNLFQHYDTNDWDITLENYLKGKETLIEKYQSQRNLTKIPVKINNVDFTLSSGSHNQLQKEIIEEFGSRFAQNSRCLYIGDSTERDLYKDTETLKKLGFEITLHDKMPDVVLYDDKKNWLFFIEAVTSVGPMSPKRIIEIKEMTEAVDSGMIYVTAFNDFKTYKKFSDQLAWETEVWIAEMPDHMIHLNGNKFVGPYSNNN